MRPLSCHENCFGRSEFGGRTASRKEPAESSSCRANRWKLPPFVLSSPSLSETNFILLEVGDPSSRLCGYRNAWHTKVTAAAPSVSTSSIPPSSQSDNHHLFRPQFSKGCSQNHCSRAQSCSSPPDPPLLSSLHLCRSPLGAVWAFRGS